MATTPKEARADGPATRKALLASGKRRSLTVPLRRAFLQGGALRTPVPGPLAELVRRHDRLGLDLLLLLLAVASASPYDTYMEPRVWSRALETNWRSLLKAIDRLAAMNLLQIGRPNGGPGVTLLREDGSGRPYEHPGAAKGDAYLKIPFAYWSESWDKSLSVPAKAVLLIALSLRHDFILPAERAKDWYGLSADTVERGQRELIRVKALEKRFEYKTAPLAPRGYTRVAHYGLLGDFAKRAAAITGGTA